MRRDGIRGRRSTNTQAASALKSARAALSSMIQRKPDTKESCTARLSADATVASTPGGNAAPANRPRWPSRNAPISCDTPASRNLSSRPVSNAHAITMPKIAIASSAAVLDTALLTPEAIPATSGPTEFITVVVSGATVTVMPGT